METKLAILRGINVGGKRKVLMTDLKNLFHKLGFKEVSTYIQTGNVIFSSSVTSNNEGIASKIETAIYQEYGFEVPVIIRSKKQLADLVKRNPFYPTTSPSLVRLDKSLHLTFLKNLPTPATLSDIKTFVKIGIPDEFIIDGQEVFILCRGKYHQSKFTNNFFEKKLMTSATTRSWSTVLKLLEIITKNNTNQLVK